jgi:hypothetical protein
MAMTKPHQTLLLVDTENGVRLMPHTPNRFERQLLHLYQMEESLVRIGEVRPRSIRQMMLILEGVFIVWLGRALLRWEWR